MPATDPIAFAVEGWAIWARNLVAQMLAAGVEFEFEFTPGDMDTRAVADALLPLFPGQDVTISSRGVTVAIQGGPGDSATPGVYYP